MSTVQEIESAIEHLPQKEKWDLFHRLQDILWEDWDRQIEEDARTGRLDDLVAKAKAEIASGQVKPLDEVLGDS